MTSNSGDPGDQRPDLNKHPDNTEATQSFTPPVNPYPEQPTYPAASDQFAPYTPPQYGDPLNSQFPPPYPAPQYPSSQYPTSQYPESGFTLADVPPIRLQPAAVAATRILGAVALVGALSFIAYGWLTWASFEPKYTDAAKVSVNGWGQVFQDGSQLIMDPGTAGMPFAAFFIPFLVLPVAILALLVICNIGRFGNSIAILVLSVLHLFVALAFLAVPSTCIIFDNDDDSVFFEGLNHFSTGPGTILATATLVVMTGTSIAGVVLGRKANPSPVAPAGPGGYRGF